MRWSSCALPKLLSYSLKSFPVSIEATIEHILYPRLCDIQSEFEILFAHRFVTSWLVTSPTARTWLAEKCLLSGTWKQVVVYTGAVPDLSEYYHQTWWILWQSKCQFIKSLKPFQQILITCELKWGYSFTESSILFHVDCHRSNVYSLHSFINTYFDFREVKKRSHVNSRALKWGSCSAASHQVCSSSQPQVQTCEREVQWLILNLFISQWSQEFDRICGAGSCLPCRLLFKAFRCYKVCPLTTFKVLTLHENHFPWKLQSLSSPDLRALSTSSTPGSTTDLQLIWWEHRIEP